MLMGELTDVHMLWGYVSGGEVAIGEAAVVACVQQPHAVYLHQEHCRTQHVTGTIRRDLHAPNERQNERGNEFDTMMRSAFNRNIATPST